MNHPPTILVIFGATGDLVRKKIVPALWHLFEEEKLPPDFSVVGFSRRDLTQNTFREHVGKILVEYRKNEAGADSASFLKLFRFVQGFFEKKEAYLDLQDAIARIERQSGICANKLFYLAVTPDAYQTVLTNLASSGLSVSCSDGSGSAPLEVGRQGRPPSRKRDGLLTGWTRIVVEKPFGRDADTAQALDELLGRLFKEEQIYRIDHYLAKEMIQNILAFRFSNNLFERNWGRDTIERIDIRLWEKIGVEDRGGFYDGIGALRDVGQNHLLQMLALVTMDRPEDLTATALRHRRAEILETLVAPSRSEIIETSIRAQYQGYRAIRGVDPHSRTETYFRISAALNAPRWRGVAITLESGKRLAQRRKEIVITFRHPMPCLCPLGAAEHYRNRIVISLEPEERIAIHFWSKKPGFAYDLEERTLTFLLRAEVKRSQYVEEYKKLLLDCITGDQTLFVSTKDVKAMWRFIDPIGDVWREGAAPLLTYAPDANEIVVRASQAAAAAKPPRLKPKLGFVGLGKMGSNMVRRLIEQGWDVVAYNRSPEPFEELVRAGAERAADLRDLVARLSGPRLVWLMVTAGKAVDEVLFGKQGLALFLKKGDTVIDGGNSFYEDSIRRAKKLARRGIHFLDVGISGGLGGARHGACLMIGGEEKIYRQYEELFAALSTEGGYAYMGKSGAGHFVKMVHNGIEYGMMQSLAEGFALLRAADSRGLGFDAEKRGKIRFKFNLKEIADLYNHGSVIESRLVGWLKDAYDAFGEGLTKVSGSVGHTGEGEWTVKTARKLKIPTPIIKGAFDFRVKSKKKPSYTGQILTALRNQFGGHNIKSKTKKQNEK